MESDTGVPIREIRVDGGASQSDLLMQIQADLLGIPVQRPVNIETTALGAAMLAGVSSKHWKNEKTFEPTISDAKRKEIESRWANAISKA